ncbi:putative C6 finger domain protein [Amniculicola lignicola CBS 123094]|uniref:Putative C6 finger domain protein n=1 Tax=Amniculicola lignicola CBS 123094 TaxID=1392246 RepID=A0A6A5X0G2_9PLEO|nr:putative C6 finger domain protein [Amniculicola lignicola CBS 123094]
MPSPNNVDQDAGTRSRSSAIFRTRRPHQKSRGGCFACKRRKRKCDELKPSCTRCESTFQKCSYPPAKGSKDPVSLPSPPCRHSSESPKASAYSRDSPSFETSVELTSYSDSNGDLVLCLSDVDLYQHYVEHTSHTLTHFPGDQGIFQTAIPALALRNKMVFYSLQALSAVCMCCDMIDQEPPPNVDAINHILMTGYRLCNLASEQMRDVIAQPDTCTSDIELLLASVVLLVPFTAASQQVSHWISSRSKANKSHRLLSTTPRDVIVMMRGIRATFQALDSRESVVPRETGLATVTSPPLLNLNGLAALPPSRTHVMFPIIAATSQAALSKLQERLNSHLREDGHEQNQSSACAAAFEVLVNIRTETLSHSDSSAQLSARITTKEPRTGSWMRCYASRHAIPQPTEPLTYFFLAFLVQAPQAYLDLVLPLLDQRLESPPVPSDTIPQFTKEQALALDIYAHWSVLMFLVEDESWWIGKLPIVTLTGMLNRYGDSFVGRLWPGERHSQGQWWPGRMLRILREVKGY